MSVYLPKGCTSYRYDFEFKKKRYTGSTEQTTIKAAQAFERAYRDRLKREAQQAALDRAAGAQLAAPAPRFADWAAVYRDQVDRFVAQGRLTRPDRVHDLLRVVLRFFGARPSGKDPKNPAVDGEPYHDLRLTDPIANPQWIVTFEEWMATRAIAGQTKNQYRSLVRQMYQLALQPKWRAVTGVAINPMDGIYRDRPGSRDVVVTPDELRAILRHASYHLRLALAIGALAPKLRLANILALEWERHFDDTMRFITVQKHKTVTTTQRPLVVPVSAQLRDVLLDARKRRHSRFVVTYQGRPIKSLRGALRNAVEAAGLRYGRQLEDGVTFHTLRHSAATMLAELGLSEAQRKAAMGHQHLATTQRYTHLRPVQEIPTLEALSDAFPLKDLVTVPRMRARRSAGVGSADVDRRPETPPRRARRSRRSDAT